LPEANEFHPNPPQIDKYQNLGQDDEYYGTKVILFGEMLTGFGG
jgi:hypothetical protein